MEAVTDFLFRGSEVVADGDPSHDKTIAPWQESYDKPRGCVEKQRHYSADKGLHSRSYGLPGGHERL